MFWLPFALAAGSSVSQLIGQNQDRQQMKGYLNKLGRIPKYGAGEKLQKNLMLWLNSKYKVGQEVGDLTKLQDIRNGRYAGVLQPYGSSVGSPQVAPRVAAMERAMDEGQKMRGLSLGQDYANFAAQNTLRHKQAMSDINAHKQNVFRQGLEYASNYPSMTESLIPSVEGLTKILYNYYTSKKKTNNTTDDTTTTP